MSVEEVIQWSEEAVIDDDEKSRIAELLELPEA